jgi:phage host-nuclease inhibitor protein Gam
MTTPRNREAADQLLRRLGEIEIATSRIEARMNCHIQAAKERATAEAADMPKERAAIEEALQEFFLIERKKLGPKARSLKLTFGALGLRARRAVEYIRGWTEATAIIALAAEGHGEFVRQKLTLHKEAVLDAADECAEMFDRCGIRVERGDTFYAKPDLAALGDLGSETGGHG